MTLSPRSGKWTASHSRNSGATSWGRRSGIHPADGTPSSPARGEDRLDELVGDRRDRPAPPSNAPGTPASTSRPSAASRLAGAGARGSSSAREPGIERGDRDGHRHEADAAASSASRSRSRNTRSDLVVIVTGWPRLEAHLEQRRVMR